MAEIDLMEYSSDSSAAAAYVTNAAQDYISNSDISNDEMADITSWTDGDDGSSVSSQATFDGKSCMKLEAWGSGGALRYRDVGTFGTRTVLSFNLYCDLIGARGSDINFRFEAYDGTTGLYVDFASDGLFVYDGATWNEVGTNLVVQDTWQEWTFDVDWTAKTTDIYLNKTLVASNVDCSWATAQTNGSVHLFQLGYSTTHYLSYIDWLKTGSDFESLSLQSYSEATIKTQGSYALKVVAAITDSLNKTLTKTF